MHIHNLVQRTPSNKIDDLFHSPFKYIIPLIPHAISTTGTINNGGRMRADPLVIQRQNESRFRDQIKIDFGLWNRSGREHNSDGKNGYLTSILLESRFTDYLIPSLATASASRVGHITVSWGACLLLASLRSDRIFRPVETVVQP